MVLHICHTCCNNGSGYQFQVMELPTYNSIHKINHHKQIIYISDAFKSYKNSKSHRTEMKVIILMSGWSMLIDYYEHWFYGMEVQCNQSLFEGITSHSSISSKGSKYVMWISKFITIYLQEEGTCKYNSTCPVTNVRNEGSST